MKQKAKFDLGPESRGRGEGRIVRKSGSRKLYVDFFYFGHRIERSTGKDDTPENREDICEFLDRIMRDIKSGTFRFAKAFPGASDEEKSRFARLEGWSYRPEPHGVLFGDYLEQWVKRDLEEMSHSTSVDYLSSINPWIRPYFADLTFFQINSTVIGQFVKTLKHRQSDAERIAGIEPRPFSKKRVKNILSHLRRIWESACEENRWQLPSPFPPPQKRSAKSKQGERPVKEVKEIVVTEKDLKRNGLQELEADRLPLRFHEWEQIYRCLDPWYQPIAELMALTGMIPSEVAGLCGGHVVNGFIHVRQIISRSHLYDEAKTYFRIRDIRITRRIQHNLDIIIGRSPKESPFLVTTKGGSHFTHGDFWRHWGKAVKASGVPYRVPYCLRHSFTAWSLAIGVDMNRLVTLMGHSTKEMIFTQYGRYVEGLEKDREKIRELFGDDF